MIKKMIAMVLSAILGLTSLGPVPEALAQSLGLENLPAPGVMVKISQDFNPLQFKGIQVYDNNPLHVDFLVDKGETGLLGEPLKEEIARLSKYFLTCLTVPEKDMWVNLSPYEKDRIAPDDFGVTLMGKDLLEQDYLLKQMTASLIFPEGGLGREFWSRVYAKAYETFGTTDIPVDVFNKVWIVPQSARVYSRGNSAFVVESRLDVMLENDHQAAEVNRPAQVSDAEALQARIYNEVAREILLPQLRREINEGRHFATVRQVFGAMILATWYKRHLRQGLLLEKYVGKNKVRGVDVDDKMAKDKIFERYLEAFRRKVYDYIRDDYDAYTQTTIPRKYVSGGMDFAGFGSTGDRVYAEQASKGAMALGPDLAMASINLSVSDAGGKVLGFPDARLFPATHPFKAVPRSLRTRVRAWIPKLMLGVVLAVSGLSADTLLAGQAEAFSGKAAIERQIKFQEKALHEGIHRMEIHGGEAMVRLGQIEKLKKKLLRYAREREVAAPVLSTSPKAALAAPSVMAHALVASGVEPGVAMAADPEVRSVDLTSSTMPMIQPLAVALVTPPAQGVPAARQLTAPPVLPAVSAPENIKVSGNTAPDTLTPPVTAVSAVEVAPPLPFFQDTLSAPVWGLGSALALALAAGGAGYWLIRRQSSRTIEAAGPITEAPARVVITSGGGAPPSPDEQELAFLERQAHSSSSSGARVLIVHGQEAPVPDAREQVINAGLLSQMEALTGRPFNYKDPAPSRWMDTSGWLLGMAGAYAVTGTDPVALAGSALALPFITRAFYGWHLWSHEVFGHAVPAGMTAPFSLKTWRTALGSGNLSGNWGGQWVNLLLPWRVPQGNPYVIFPAKGDDGWRIARAGTATTSVMSAGLAAAGGALALSGHDWVWPLLGPLAVTSLAAVTGAWWSDSQQGAGERFDCGIIGFGRWGTAGELAGQGDKSSLQWMQTMMRRLLSRGGHSAGLVKMRTGPEREVQITVEKDMTAKHGLNRNFVGGLFGRFEKKIRPLDPMAAQAGFMLDLSVGHNRWATGGKVTVQASHPHVSGIGMEPHWDFQQGLIAENDRLVTANVREVDEEDGSPDNDHVVASAIGHNGDNDAYRFFAGDRYITDLDELRELFSRLTHFDGDLPPGDSPIIAMQVLYHATQGNWYAAARYAYTEAHHRSVDEIKADLLSLDEERQLGDFFNRRFRKFAPLLARPGLQKNNKTLQDCWVTREMAEARPALREQYRMLRQLRDAFINDFRRAAVSGELPANVARHWQGTMLETFVDMALERFFTGSRFQAAREFKERSKGTYGLFIQLSTDLNGVTLISRKQGVVFGYDRRRRIFAFASDPYSIQEKDEQGRQLEILLYLNPAGEGEILDVQVSQETGDLLLTPYSVEQGRYLDENELKSRHQPLAADNPYYAPLPPVTTLLEDLRDIPGGLRDARASFERSKENLLGSSRPGIEASYLADRESFNYRSAEEMLKRLLTLWVEKRMFAHIAYIRVLPDLNRQVRAMAASCAGGGSGCSDAEIEMLRRESAVVRADDSVLMRLIRRRIIDEAKTLAGALLAGDMGPEELDARLSYLIPRLAEHVLSRINADRLPALHAEWEHEEGRVLPQSIDGGKMYDVLIAGYEKSEMTGRVIEQLLNCFFPGLSVKAVNSNDLLAYRQERLDLNKIRLGLILGDFGSNFSDLEGANILMHAIGARNVFGMSSRIDSTLNVVLGQSLSPDAEFTNRVFVTGELRQSEAATYSEAVQMGCAINLVFHLARRMNALLPQHKPFGLSLTAKDEEAIAGLEDMMIQDAERVTGVDVEGRAVTRLVGQQAGTAEGAFAQKDVHRLIVLRAGRLSARFMETPFVNVLFWSYVIAFPAVFGGGILGLMTGHHSVFMTALEGVVTLTLGGIILPYLYKVGTGSRWQDRTGPPPNISYAGEDGFYQMESLYYSKIFSRATKGMGSQPQGAHIRRDAISKLAPLMARGSILSAHLPSDPYLLGIAKNAIGQLKVTRTSIFGVFKRWLSGAHAYTTSRLPFRDPNHNVSDSNIVIGGEKNIPGEGVSESVRMAYNQVIDPFGGYLADKVQWGWVAHFSSLGRRLRTYEDTTGRAAAATTQTPVPPPEVLPVRSPDRAQQATDVLARKTPGGIDMSGRGMTLVVDEAPAEGPGQVRPELTAIGGVTPQIGSIVPVTPGMLSVMLGDGM